MAVVVGCREIVAVGTVFDTGDDKKPVVAGAGVVARLLGMKYS
jgi:hypothetical protein